MANVTVSKSKGNQGNDRRGRPTNPNSVRQITMAVVDILKRENLVMVNPAESDAKKGRVGRKTKVDA
jgi:hypothetical protein